jgi:ABC-type Na+ efflux pump permease subunit
MPSKVSSKLERFPILFALIALALGIGCGALHVMVETMEEPDPLLSALAVTFVSMMLGTIRPRRPWRWVLLIGVPVPLVMWASSLVDPTLHFTRAAIAGSLLISLPGFAGAFGGSVLRTKIQQIFYEESEEEKLYPSKPAVDTASRKP